MLRPNLRDLLDVVFRAGIVSGEIEEEPKYKLKFNPLWSLSETEQATVEKTKADTELVKAQTAQVYVDMQALDPSEVRKGLAGSEDFNVEELIEEDESFAEEIVEAVESSPETEAVEKNAEENGAPGGAEQTAAPQPTAAPSQKPLQGDGVTRGVGVLVIREGQILTGLRRKEGVYGGPGGHIEAGETPEQAAMRETAEEFGITPNELIPIGTVSGLPADYGEPQVFLCTDFAGEPVADGEEMADAAFMPFGLVVDLIDNGKAFEPFARSIELFLSEL